MTVRKKSAPKVKQVAKSARVKLAKTITAKAATGPRPAFAANLQPRHAVAGAPAGGVTMLAPRNLIPVGKAAADMRTITLLGRSSPAATPSASAVKSKTARMATTVKGSTK